MFNDQIQDMHDRYQIVLRVTVALHQWSPLSLMSHLSGFNTDRRLISGVFFLDLVKPLTQHTRLEAIGLRGAVLD